VDVKFKRRTLWFVLVIMAIYSAWAVPAVSAHALLVRSNPSSNAVLEKPPVQVELFFSEAVEQQLSTIRVIDSSNTAVDAGDVRVDPANPTRMTVSLRSIPDGVYTVAWKAVSAVDGHQSTGSFPFAVGNANAGAVSTIQETSGFRLPFSTLISKFLMLASLGLLIGRQLYTVLVWEPVIKGDLDQIGRPPIWSTLYRSGLIGLLVSIGLGILGQAGQSTGRELGFPWDSETGRILLETHLGIIWLSRIGMVLLAVWLANRNESAWRDWSAFAVNLVMLLTVALTSHAATEPHPLVPVLVDWLHLFGMTFWFGGLAYFFTAMLHIRNLEGGLRTRLTSALIVRFSANALIFVSLIGLTGLYSAYLRVGSIPALLDTLYGHVLMVKQVFVAGLLLIAATNLLVVSPRLRKDRLQGTANIKLIDRFGKLLIGELTLAALLLASVSFLTYIPPAKIPGPVSTDFTSTKQADDINVEINISPARVGQNKFMLMLFTQDGKAVTTAKEVLLRFTPLQGNIPPSDLQMIGDGYGMYSAQGAYLSLPGKWQVQAVVRRADKFDAFANFDLALKGPSGASGSAALPQEAGLLLMGIGLLLVMLCIPVPWHLTWRPATGVPLALLLIGLGIIYLTRPTPVTAEQANPITPNRESIAAGQALYTVNCAPCHGQTGKGDGPMGLALNPRPADLTQHAILGVHTDAQLFEWIMNGFPGSQMPAFQSKLSDTDRWNLVNFIRTFPPK
jgi:copper transport protein